MAPVRSQKRDFKVILKGEGNEGPGRDLTALCGYVAQGAAYKVLWSLAATANNKPPHQTLPAILACISDQLIGGNGIAQSRDALCHWKAKNFDPAG